MANIDINAAQPADGSQPVRKNKQYLEMETRISVAYAKATDADRAAIKALIDNAKAQAPKKFVEQSVPLTPGMAAIIMVELNGLNRPIQPKRMFEFAEAWRDGEYQETHQGIAFYVNGKLFDGQHRIGGVAISGTTIVIDITFNLPMEALKVVDQSVKRRVGDALQFEGIDDGNYKVAVVKEALPYINAIDSLTTLHLTPTKVDAYVKQNDKMLSNALALAASSVDGIKTPPMKITFAASVAYILLQGGWDASKVHGFLTEVQTGVTNRPESPAAAVNAAFSIHAKSKRIAPTHRIAIIIKALNYWVDGKSAKKIDFNPSREDLPNYRAPDHRPDSQPLMPEWLQARQ